VAYRQLCISLSLHTLCHAYIRRWLLRSRIILPTTQPRQRRPECRQYAPSTWTLHHNAADVLLQKDAHLFRTVFVMLPGNEHIWWHEKLTSRPKYERTDDSFVVKQCINHSNPFARIAKSSLSAPSKTLYFQDPKRFTRNSKGVTPIEDVKWEGLRKIGDFQPISRHIAETGQDGAKVTIDHY